MSENVDARFKVEMRSRQHFLVDTELERVRRKVFNYALMNLNAKIVDQNVDHFFNNLKCVAKESESSSGVHIEQHRRWKVQIFLRTRKQYPAGLAQTCVQQG